MRGQRPSVSIGLPVRNGEQFLAEALDSILSQTFEDYELIISDNASTDATPEICRHYARRDPRIRYFRSDVNAGAAKNFNQVFELSAGEYFKWSAADDVLAPEFLEACKDALESVPAAVLAYTKARCIDEDGKAIGVYDQIMRGGGKGQLNATQAFRQLVGEFEDNGGASAPIYVFGLIRSSALRKPRPMGNYILADCNLVADLILRGRFCQIPRYLSFIRSHPGSSAWFRAANWSTEKAQQFFDPSVSGRIPLFLSLRRHHFEYFVSVVGSQLSRRDKVELLRYCMGPPLRQLGKKANRIGRSARRLLPGGPG